MSIMVSIGNIHQLQIVTISTRVGHFSGYSNSFYFQTVRTDTIIHNNILYYSYIIYVIGTPTAINGTHFDVRIK